MPIVHVIKPGECLASVAAAYGFADPAVLYDHPANADLRKLRPNWNVLLPGDRVTVPHGETKRLRLATGTAHRFVATRPRAELRVRLVDAHDRPLANTKYRLVVGDATKDGTTDGHGFVRAPVPIAAIRAEFQLWVDDPAAAKASDTFLLQIGALAPIDDARGVQSRLANLGYWCGAADGMIGARSKHALKAFQARHGLPVTGEIDDHTRTKLEAEHGS